MIYLEVTLSDGSLIHNASIEDNMAQIETDSGDEMTLDLNEKVDVDVYIPISITTVHELIVAFNTKNLYVNIDGEDATFQTFPDEDLKTLIKNDFIELDNISSLSYMPIGKKKGGTKEMTLAKMFALIDEHE